MSIRKILVITLLVCLSLSLSCNLFFQDNESRINISCTLGSRALTNEMIESMSLTITGSGMDTITADSKKNSISVNVPKGKNRGFDLNVTTADGTSYSGATTTDISGNSETINIELIFQTSTDILTVELSSSDHENLDESLEGVITDDVIIFTVPSGTDITSITPIFTPASINISPASGVTQDFTEPVVYTVTSPDGLATKEYTCSAYIPLVEFTIEDFDLENPLNILTTFVPSDATNTVLTWESSDETIVTVSETGVLTKLAIGEATITAMSSDGGFEKEFTITILDTDPNLPGYVAVTGISIILDSTPFYLSDSPIAEAVITPSNATNKNISWSSSDTEILTIDPDTGLITPLAVGDVDITVTTDDGGTTSTLTVSATADIVISNNETVVTIPGYIYGQTSGMTNIISSFSIGAYEMTYSTWYTVVAWAKLNEYTFANDGRQGMSGTIGAVSSSEVDPVTTISWRDAIVFCNAYSEWDTIVGNGNTSAIYYDQAGNILKDATSAECDSATLIDSVLGYRLPTEGEWQLAGNTRTSGVYEYTYLPGTNIFYEDIINVLLPEFAWVYENSDYTTHEVNTKTPSEVGLYNMSGNVAEMCFDVDSSTSMSNYSNYSGLYSGSSRIYKGGSVNDMASTIRTHDKVSLLSTDTTNTLGFRVVLSTGIPIDSITTFYINDTIANVNDNIFDGDTFYAGTMPNNASSQRAKWSSSDTQIIMIDEVTGFAYYVNDGPVTITAEIFDGVTTHIKSITFNVAGT